MSNSDNTSATGGYLSPEIAFGLDLENSQIKGLDEGYFGAKFPLNAQQLNQLFATVIAGITGLDPTLVRPSAQIEPGNIPVLGNAWCAFGFRETTRDTFAWEGHSTSPDGSASDMFKRNKIIELLCSFYDMGTNGIAADLADLLADGLQVEQNRAILRACKIAVVETGTATPVPTLTKERWLYRVDLPVTFRMLVERNYPILNLVAADATIEAQNASGGIAITETITVTE